MKKSLYWFAIALLAVALVLVAGCTGTGDDNGKDTVDGTAAPAINSLSFGYQPSTHQIAYMVASDKGMWKEDLAQFGITEITDHKFPTGAPEMQAMMAGEIDVAYVGAAPVISALANGLDARIVAGVQVQGSDLVIRPDIKYESPADLKGLIIATFPEGTIQDTLLRNWLSENGLDPEKDVDIRPMGPGDATVAIAEGAVDAVFLPHPAPSVIANEGKGVTIVQSGSMEENHACCVLLVSGNLIRNHPDVVDQIVKTHIKATEYAMENQDEAAEIFQKMNKIDIDVVKKSFSEWDGKWIEDPNMITDSVVNYTDIQASLGYIKKPLAKDEIFDLSFYEKAVETA
ncbi:ABC transporter substrate-binding protein [Methanoplanus sp. FWC-SCC4]|uniref:ABC transporter substrate-binding protein n=1 Tax=Methanochimaera problematica TaxID=2609417 RepID=A0AA97I1R9_9EURY|nr:ABC transporter substrate-binding protein [Methanoplanus sp. FWC-SCC4]WOF15450.1 ABC transporter substrate-binding protein [Methanoplanus sp. FWC-SCC4]